MSANKKNVREAFRQACFQRDRFTCIACGFKSTPEKARDELDAHHVNDRHTFKNSGYVGSNGVTLCKAGKNCHLQAEMWLKYGMGEPGLSPAELYAKIGSSRQQAEKDDEQNV